MIWTLKVCMHAMHKRIIFLLPISVTNYHASHWNAQQKSSLSTTWKSTLSINPWNLICQLQHLLLKLLRFTPFYIQHITQTSKFTIFSIYHKAGETTPSAPSRSSPGGWRHTNDVTHQSGLSIQFAWSWNFSRIQYLGSALGVN